MDKVYVPQHVSTTFFEDNAVLLDLNKNVYYGLNNTASEFWKALMQLNSIDSALKEVLKLYNGYSADVIRQDMEELVHSFVQAGLLVLSA